MNLKDKILSVLKHNNEKNLFKPRKIISREKQIGNSINQMLDKYGIENFQDIYVCIIQINKNIIIKKWTFIIKAKNKEEIYQTILKIFNIKSIEEFKKEQLKILKIIPILSSKKYL